MKGKLLVVLAGPTAVGKTSLGIKLAKHFNSEIISADSRQLYKELNIGVARPSVSELEEVKHHFIASQSITEDYNAGSYSVDANTLLKQLFIKHNILFMVGGTGLYIQAATQGLNSLPSKDEKLRSKLSQLYQNSGIAGLQAKLKALDPKAQIKDWENPQRLIRAIEIISRTKVSLEKNMEEIPQSRDYETLFLYLDMDRDLLYKRINHRVDVMIKSGLEAEARSLLKFRELNALQTVGYRELFDYFDNKISLEKAIELIKQHSRNYAKRQLTWFKNKSYLRIENYNQGLELIKAQLQKL